MSEGFWSELIDQRDPGTGEESPGVPISPDAALKAIVSSLSPLGAEFVIPTGALGRILASHASSVEPLPPFDGSKMDGYAVIAADTALASADGPAVLNCDGAVFPGQVPPCAVTTGRAMRIMTGAAIPEGADAVVKVEETDGGAERVRVFCPVSPGDNIAPRGEICAAGSVVLKAGTRVRWPAMALLAAAGVDRVEVFRVPRLSVFTTGDELVGLGGHRSGSGVRNATLPALMGLAAREGLALGPCGEAGDDPEEIAARLAEAMAVSDAVVFTGGVSMGLRDNVRRVLSAAGFKPVVGAVSQKPGKPMGVFVPGPGFEGRPAVAFGLPGNPVSSMVCAFRYLLPALRVLAGRRAEDALPRKTACVLDSRAVNRDADRTSFVPVVLTVPPGGVVPARAKPLRLRSSADVFTFAGADGLMAISPGATLEPETRTEIEIFEFSL